MGPTSNPSIDHPCTICEPEVPQLEINPPPGQVSLLEHHHHLRLPSQPTDLKG
ncbi:conserved hypothetical protein, partial [Ricinus communis]